MTLKEAKHAKENNLPVRHIEEPNCGGWISNFDDEETGFYYNQINRTPKYGTCFAPIEKMEVGKFW